MTKNAVYVLGAIALILGVIGFFNDPIFGVFEVDAVHNIILIIVGLALLASAAMGNEGMGAKVVGIVVAVIAVLGFIPPTTTVIGIADTNVASSVLQAVVAIILLYVGFTGGRGNSMPSSTPPNAPAAPGGGGGPQV